MRTHILKLFTIAFVVVLAISASNKSDDFEGSIVYELSYEDLPDAMKKQEADLPKEATLKIKGQKAVLFLGDAPTSIADTKDSTIIILVEMFGRKAASKMPLGRFLKKYEAATEITNVDGSKKIAGYNCKKAILSQKGIETDLYYTDKINAKHFQYSKVDGFPLEFTEAFMSMKTHYKATKVKEEKVDDSAFEVPDDYEMKN